MDRRSPARGADDAARPPRTTRTFPTDDGGDGEASVPTVPDPGVQPGDVIGGRYRLTERVSRGGIGAVWRADDQTLQRTVAVKIVQGLRDVDGTASRRFRREAVAVANLQHRHIVTLYDADHDGRLAYLVMEHLAGGSLDAAGASSRLGPDGLGSLAYQTAAALAVTHRHDIVHRDIKPGNILLTHRGLAKLGDFGIARRLHGATLTPDGEILGTARYLAPEQVDNQPATPASDVYSLGLVLWETWAGRPAFQGDTPAATAVARVEEDLRPPGTVRAGLPDPLDAVIDTATARSPDRRYPDGTAMREALDGLVGHRPERLTAVLADDSGA